MWRMDDILFSAEPPYRWALHDSLFQPSRIIFRNFTAVYFLHELLSLEQG
jgi:hypothetical protein